MLNDLKKIIEIPSVLGEPAENAPFGVECRKALDAFLALARGYGFRTGEDEGYCGWAEYGEGERLVAAACHLDVVPAGTNWTYPPFGLTVEGGRIYGRGVADDKGPAIACLHALKELKESGFCPNARLRLIVGLNEENGSACLKHYREHCELPAYTFVPDSDFPIISSEKAILHLQAAIKTDDAFNAAFYDFAFGVRPNVVPAEAAVNVKPSPLYDALKEVSLNGLQSLPAAQSELLGCGFKESDFSFHILQEDCARAEARGRAGHAMSPDKADNAAWKLLRLLSALYPISETLRTVAHLFCTPLAAERLGIDCRDECGEQTLSLGLARYEGGMLKLTFDLRCPKCADKKQIVAAFQKALGKREAEIKELYYAPLLYVEEDSPLVTRLLQVYTQATGNSPYCLHIGGGTYARELPNAVAFGAAFPGDETNIHNADESFPLDKFLLLPGLYAQAFKALAELN